MPNPSEQIDSVVEARELLAMATPGPWQVYSDGDGYCVGRDTGNALAYGAAITGWGSVRQTKPDAELIARAPELLKTLADEVERLRRRVKQMEREAREDARDAAAEARWQERQGEDYGSY